MRSIRMPNQVIVGANTKVVNNNQYVVKTENVNQTIRQVDNVSANKRVVVGQQQQQQQQRISRWDQQLKPQLQRVGGISVGFPRQNN